MGDSAHGVPSAGPPGVIAEDKNLLQPQVTDRHTPVASVHQSEEASRVLWTFMKQILCCYFLYWMGLEL